MLDLIYLICIAPLEFCMRHILDWGFDLTKSYGPALIFMSLAVNTVILPIYNKVEGWQEEERALKARMAPMETMIREVFKGQERFAMISTLYRQHGYSQFMTLRASIGVLLQIPFFFAAYHLLSNMEALHGVSFGPIRDLGAPDELFVVGGFSINILPILMTVVNLVSAFFYTHDLSRRDKIQLYGMAALFLVLLYNSPAALTFYWTLNNVYSLGKNIVEKDWMKRQGWIAALEKLAEQRTRLAQRAAVLWARALSMQVGLSAVVAVLGGAGLFMLVRGLLGHGKYSFEMSAMIFGAFLLFIGICYFAEEKVERLKKMTLPQALAVLAGIIGVSYILAKYGFHQGNEKKVAVKMALVAGAACLLTYGRTLWGTMYAKIAPQKNTLGALFLPSAGLIAFLIFVYCPFMVFSSDPAVFGMRLEDFASSRFGMFFVAMICLAVFGGLVRPVKWIFGSAFSMMAFAALAFCFVVAPDVGVMDAFVFQKPEALTRWYNTYIDAAVAAVIVLFFVIAVQSNKAKIMMNVVYASLTVLVVMTGVHYFDVSEKQFKNSYTEINDGGMPQYVKDFYTFSKNGKNIVVVMLDMFTGGNMNQILEQYPSIKTDLDGFTWYEDVVSSGSLTILGKPGILGGENCHPVKLNEDRTKSLEEKISKEYGMFFRKLQHYDYKLSIHDVEFFEPELLAPYLESEHYTNFVPHKESALWPDASKLWAQKNNTNLYNNQKFDIFWNIISLFNVSPVTFKKYFYCDGGWMSSVSKGNYDFTHAAINLANLELPSYISSVSDDDKNSFIYMFNLMTHVPWAIDENGMPCPNGASFESRDIKNHGVSASHVRAEYYSLKTLLKWFEWMKDNGVYDNTQIILVSDHGAHDSKEIVKIWNDIYPIALHSLLLVKPINTRGELRIDRTTPMSNSDVPHIIMNEIITVQSEKNFPWKDTNRERVCVSGEWRRENHPKNNFEFSMVYKIRGPLYDKNSWVKIK
ncbi:YidC/Oxa1 family membrane protein insertase [Mailhella sp.]